MVIRTWPPVTFDPGNGPSRSRDWEPARWRPGGRPAIGRYAGRIGSPGADRSRCHDHRPHRADHPLPPTPTTLVREETTDLCGSLLGAVPSRRRTEPCGSAPWSTGAQRSEPQQRSEMTPTRPATPTDP